MFSNFVVIRSSQRISSGVMTNANSKVQRKLSAFLYAIVILLCQLCSASDVFPFNDQGVAVQIQLPGSCRVMVFRPAGSAQASLLATDPAPIWRPQLTSCSVASTPPT